MFGHNEVVGRRYFREHPAAAAGKLLVTSIFGTVQGEGPLAGVPAVFVRLAKCQLQCAFCDTYFDAGTWMSFDEVRVRAEAVRAAADLVVVTGGEPALQENLVDFLDEVLLQGPFTQAQVETNGLLSLDLPRRSAVSHRPITVVVSPKAPQGKYQRPREDALDRADALKFVLSGDPSSPYHEVPRWALDLGVEVFVSPMAEYRCAPAQTRALYEARSTPGMAERSAAERVSFWEPGLLDLERCRRNYEYAGRYAMERGVRLTVQMQLFASMP